MRDRDLETVEIERSSKGMAAAFIENASYTSLLLTFLCFAVFQSAYVYTGMRSPSLINTTTVRYPLTQEYSNRAATAKIQYSMVMCRETERRIRYSATTSKNTAMLNGISFHMVILKAML